MKNEILEEIRKIPNLIEGERIKSFLIFNLNQIDKNELYNSISQEFTIIHDKLHELRKKEILEIYNSQKPYFENYVELEERYKNSERLEYVKQLHAELRLENSKMLSKLSTHSSELKKMYQFKELNIQEYLIKEKRFDYLNENLDFSNLINVSRNNLYISQYKLTQEEQEYEELRGYFGNYKYHESLVTYCEKYEARFDELLNSTYCPKNLNWFFLTFKISKSEFDNLFSEKTKYWTYNNDNTIIFE